jgi:hypothetical protein
MPSPSTSAHPLTAPPRHQRHSSQVEDQSHPNPPLKLRYIHLHLIHVPSQLQSPNKMSLLAEPNSFAHGHEFKASLNINLTPKHSFGQRVDFSTDWVYVHLSIPCTANPTPHLPPRPWRTSPWNKIVVIWLLAITFQSSRSGAE